MLKNIFFRTLIFLRFLIDFNGLGSIFGGPRASENCLKFVKINFGARSERGLACDMILVAISKRFLQILMDFGRIQMVFWKGFGGITNDCKRFRLQNLL